MRRRSTWSQPAFSITNTINAAQQVTQITSTLNDATDPGTLAANITYYPFGAISTLIDGCAGTGCVSRQETYDYNNRLQPVMVQLSSPGVSNCQVYNYYVNSNGTPTRIRRVAPRPRRPRTGR